MWMHRRSEEPSSTDVQCYWKKSTLAKVGTVKQFIVAKDLLETTSATQNVSSYKHSSFLQTVLNIAQTKNLDSQLSRLHYITIERRITLISLHSLMIDFVCLREGKSLVDEFISFAQLHISEDVCKEVNKHTINQSDNLLWYELRYG